MERNEIVDLIKNKKRMTLVKAFIQSEVELNFEGVKCFGDKSLYLVIGDYLLIKKVLDDNKESIKTFHIDIINRNSNIGLLDYLNVDCRIEPGAIIREHVVLSKGVVILMGAIINIGAKIGENTMIDMNAVVGSNAIIGKNVHIGAGAVISGVLEPPSSNPTIIEDNVFIGANAVILEGVKISKGSIVGASSVVTKDVPPGLVVGGVPAKAIKLVKDLDINKVKNEGDLR